MNLLLSCLNHNIHLIGQYKGSCDLVHITTCVLWYISVYDLIQITKCFPNLHIVHGILQARILERVAFPFSRGSSYPRNRTQVPAIEPRSPALQADSLPAKLQEKPKNTGVGSLSLLQNIFLIQESNWGLLQCRWILY